MSQLPYLNTYFTVNTLNVPVYPCTVKCRKGLAISQGGLLWYKRAAILTSKRERTDPAGVLNPPPPCAPGLQVSCRMYPSLSATTHLCGALRSGQQRAGGFVFTRSAASTVSSGSLRRKRPLASHASNVGGAHPKAVHAIGSQACYLPRRRANFVLENHDAATCESAASPVSYSRRICKPRAIVGANHKIAPLRRGAHPLVLSCDATTLSICMVLIVRQRDTHRNGTAENTFHD